jgi:hypothetical protein
MQVGKQLVVLLIALPLAGQTDAAKPARVEGVVTNSVTGDPVPRAHVALDGLTGNQRSQHGTMSSADGNFSLDGLAPGSWRAAAERIGFVTSNAEDRTRFTLGASDNKTGIEIKLTPTGAITGRVTDADGEPVEFASVEAQGGNGAIASRPTDERGQFRLGGLAPGRYRVKVSLYDSPGGPPEIRTDGTVEVHNAATYYPRALSEKEAGTVVVRPASETAGVDIQLVQALFVRVSGKVIGMPRGAENPGVFASQGVFGGDGNNLKPDGSFEIWRLDPGKYNISAEWTAPNGEHVETAGVEIEVAGSNIDDIELRVLAKSNIAGQLEFEDDQVKQTIQKILPGRLVELFQMGAEAGMIMTAQPQVDKTGAFRLEKVPPGKYWLGLGVDKAYVKSMRLGSTAIEGAILDLNNGSGGAGLSILLSAATGSISGTVQDDRGTAAGTVVVLTEAGPETGFDTRKTTAGADGTYTFANLPPGSYRLVAVEESNPSIRENDVLGYDNLMETVEVQAGSKVTKDLKRRMPE